LGASTLKEERAGRRTGTKKGKHFKGRAFSLQERIRLQKKGMIVALKRGREKGGGNDLDKENWKVSNGNSRTSGSKTASGSKEVIKNIEGGPEKKGQKKGAL